MKFKARLLEFYNKHPEKIAKEKSKKVIDHCKTIVDEELKKGEYCSELYWAAHNLQCNLTINNH